MPDVNAPAVTIDDIETAAARIADHVVRTPSARSTTLSALTGAEVVVKFENLQFTASFKDRGAANRLHLLGDDERSRGGVAVSAGNHAQGVAHHARRLGIQATIVMPETAAFTKVANTEALGAIVVQTGISYAEAAAAAEALADESGLTLVHPYDDPAVIAGQGTLALELLADHDLDVVIVPIGGGGLIAGVATVVADRTPDTGVIGVQSTTYPGMVAALGGRTLDVATADTLADGIAVRQPGTPTVPIVRALVADVVTVEESDIERAIVLYLEIEKTIAEGAGACPLAALLADPDRYRGRRVGLVLSGGNIDNRLLASVLMRQMVTDRRIVRLRIGVDDLPGQLALVALAIGDTGANILEVDHGACSTRCRPGGPSSPSRSRPGTSATPRPSSMRSRATAGRWSSAERRPGANGADGHVWWSRPPGWESGVDRQPAIRKQGDGTWETDRYARHCPTSRVSPSTRCHGRRPSRWRRAAWRS